MKIPKNTFLNQPKSLYPTGTYYRIRENGDIELGYGMGKKSGKNYDNTRLVVNPNPMVINGKNIYEATVMWFRSNDTIIIPRGEKYDDACRRQAHIALGLNESLLFEDPNYYAFMMEMLLEKERVERYMSMGLEENPSHECGNYVGEVGYEYGKPLEKTFDIKVGSIIHHSKEMEDLRNRRRGYQRARKEAEYRRKVEAYEDLKKQLEELEKELGESRNQEETFTSSRRR